MLPLGYEHRVAELNDLGDVDMHNGQVEGAEPGSDAGS